MKEKLQDYAKLGICHHLLYADSLFDPDEHVKTLSVLLERSDIEVVDLCVPYGERQRKEASALICASGKDITYTMHLLPLHKISLATTNPAEQAQIRLLIEDQIAVAKVIGTRRFIFASGSDPGEIHRPAGRKAFADFCRWFCGKLAEAGIVALLEPFDRTIDKKFLYGPTSECVELIRSLKPGVTNFAIELDVAHIPLMKETFAGAFRTVAPYLHYVHLGNCVLKNTASPFYGDQHPPIGLSGGEVDIPELVEIFRLCLEIGYLDKKERRFLVLEMRPFPDRSAEETVADSMERIQKAWELA